MQHHNWQSRTELAIGKEQLINLNTASVLVVGLGGVGAYAAEHLCRAGIGKLTIVDGDVVNNTNRNRQLAALKSTCGKPKTLVMQHRLFDINPDLNLKVYQEFIRDERMVEILTENNYDYVVDAIDTLSPKIFLIYHAVNHNLPIVSSMGAGGKFDPAQIKISDISKSYNCNLARMLRKKLHQLDVYKGVKVVFSTEKVDKSKIIFVENEQNKKTTLGTISYMPALFGGFCASVVIRDIAGIENNINR